MEAQAPVQTLGKATPKDIQARERYWALTGAKDQLSHPPPNESENKGIASDAGDPEQDASADGDYWYSGGDVRYPPPDLGDSWESCNKMVHQMDKSRCDVWTDEVDKLLIFAGLFSAVVTGFTIDASKTLQADPSIATVQLIAILTQQMSNGTSSDANQQAISSIISGFQNFQPEPYAIRVNIFWFLSLSLALATAIIGILCMQWLREYQRDSGLSPMEIFAVGQMRREGLERWSVPAILSALPLLLQAALILFFIGLVEYLQNANKTVAAVITTFVVVTMLFLVATTILPAFQFLLHANYHFHVPQCPFKSPQSWAFCRLSFSVCSIISYFVPELHFVVSVPERIPWRHTFERGRLALRFWHWQRLDKYWYDKRMRYRALNRSREPEDDFVNGLVRLASIQSPKVPVFYHALQCMRSS
ncbi:hypothetical protein JOM56_000307, partial [Amanita muscaria]